MWNRSGSCRLGGSSLRIWLANSLSLSDNRPAMPRSDKLHPVSLKALVVADPFVLDPIPGHQRFDA